MRKVMRVVGRILVGLVGLAGAAAVVSRIVLERRIAGEIDALLADARPAASDTVREAELDRLPGPVRRWLRYSQALGKARPTTVRLRQAGDFQLEGRGWLPYRAEQYFTTDPPGFLWKASFRMGPMVSVVGRDQYRDGQASIQMRVLSLVPVANKTGGGLNQGDLLRYLGELQLVPGRGAGRLCHLGATGGGLGQGDDALRRGHGVDDLHVRYGGTVAGGARGPLQRRPRPQRILGEPQRCRRRVRRPSRPS